MGNIIFSSIRVTNNFFLKNFFHFFFFSSNKTLITMNIAESSLNSSYKPIEYDKTIYLIPIRSINENSYVLLSDIQAIIPTASAVLSNDKLIPFEVDTNT